MTTTQAEQFNNVGPFADCTDIEIERDEETYPDHLGELWMGSTWFTVAQVRALRDWLTQVLPASEATARCVRCERPLPPLDQWSGPACENCTAIAEDVSELGTAFAMYTRDGVKRLAPDTVVIRDPADTSGGEGILGLFREMATDQGQEIERLNAEVDRLRAILNTPETADFLEGVKLEAAHQRERWGAPHDREKSAEHWYWLVGYLAGKANRAAILGDKEKALHHCISSAAALTHWHQAITLDTTGCGQGVDADLQKHDDTVPTLAAP